MKFYYLVKNQLIIHTEQKVISNNGILKSHSYIKTIINLNKIFTSCLSSYHHIISNYYSPIFVENLDTNLTLFIMIIQCTFQINILKSYV